MEEYHLIVASALLSSAFMAICGLGVVPAEEIYILVDGYDGRRIYADDSGMGYASGLKVAPGVAAAGMLFGLIFGCIWGVIVSIIRKIPLPDRSSRSA
jgi:membrane associated rhomboid family serine protease